MIRTTPDLGCFGDGPPPTSRELVDCDGFDQLDKERAVAFFTDKRWEDVFGYLQKKNSAEFFLEEWAVLRPISLAYYLRAYLAHLFNVQPLDEEFAFHFYGELNQVLHIYNGHLPLSATQSSALVRLSCTLLENMQSTAFGSTEFRSSLVSEIHCFLRGVSQHAG